MPERAARRLMPLRIEVEYSGRLGGTLAERFQAEADHRGIRPADLAAALLDAITRDNLFAAVLDT